MSYIETLLWFTAIIQGTFFLVLLVPVMRDQAKKGFRRPLTYLSGLIGSLSLYSLGYILILHGKAYYAVTPLWQDRLINFSGAAIVYFATLYFSTYNIHIKRALQAFSRLSLVFLVALSVLPFRLGGPNNGWARSLEVSVQTLYVLFLITSMILLTATFFFLPKNQSAKRRMCVSFAAFAFCAIAVDVIPYYLEAYDLNIRTTLSPLGPVGGLIFFYTLHKAAIRDDLYRLKQHAAWVSSLTLSTLAAFSIVLSSSVDGPGRISGLILAAYLAYDVFVQKSMDRKTIQRISKEYQDLQEKHLDTSDFVMDIAHRLKSPLAVIENQLREAADAPSPEEQGEKLSRATNNAHTLRLSMKNLLFAGKIDHQQIELRRRKCDLASLLNNWQPELRSLAPHHTIELVTSDNDSLTASIDEVLIKDAVFNLVDNAAKYSPAGSPIQIRLGRDRWHASITVSDQGRGIPAQELKRIFRRHYQAAPRRQRDIGSVGLGLALVKWTLEQHGGYITVSSASGRGTRVCLQLPLIDPSSSPSRRRTTRVRTAI